MQVIEYMEEYVLSSCFTRKELHIINNEGIYLQIEVCKALDVIILNGICELCSELFRRHMGVKRV